MLVWSPIFPTATRTWARSRNSSVSSTIRRSRNTWKAASVLPTAHVLSPRVAITPCRRWASRAACCWVVMPVPWTVPRSKAPTPLWNLACWARKLYSKLSRKVNPV